VSCRLVSRQSCFHCNIFRHLSSCWLCVERSAVNNCLLSVWWRLRWWCDDDHDDDDDDDDVDDDDVDFCCVDWMYDCHSSDRDNSIIVRMLVYVTWRALYEYVERCNDYWRWCRPLRGRNAEFRVVLQPGPSAYWLTWLTAPAVNMSVPSGWHGSLSWTVCTYFNIEWTNVFFCYLLFRCAGSWLS